MIKKWKKNHMYKQAMRVKMELKNLQTKLSRATLTENEEKEIKEKIEAAEKQEKELWDDFLLTQYVFLDPADRNHGYEDYKLLEPHLWPQVAGAHHYSFEPEETKQLIDNLYVRIAEDEGNLYDLLFVACI